jgi:hypothetical protein
LKQNSALESPDPDMPKAFTDFEQWGRLPNIGQDLKRPVQPISCVKRIEDDLGTADVHLQAGQLIQLHAATKSLTNKLRDVVRELK